VQKFLIVNADDFGLSPGVNHGIITAHEEGIVTSASLMVRGAAAAEAAAYARLHPDLGIGLHVDLGEWACRDGDWFPVYEVVCPDDAAAVAGEVHKQLDAFHKLLGRHPSHLDSHQHVHRSEPARSVLLDVARRLAIPLRHFTPEVCYCGDFYGQSAEGEPALEAIQVANLVRIIEHLPPGVTELACHPALGDDIETMYRTERAVEVATLCDDCVKKALADFAVQRISFGRLPLRPP
jgi:predicted glycoside hydrolase/deacetylase ChbG (UPF0249 family)